MTQHVVKFFLGICSLLLGILPAIAEESQPALYQIAEFGKWGFVDLQGRVVISPRFVTTGPFQEGLAAAFDGTLWGYIGSDGEYKIPPQFRQAFPFVNGRAMVFSTDENAFTSIDRRGNFLSGSSALPIVPPSAVEDSLTLYATEAEAGELIGFNDIDGEPIIPPRFKETSEFSEGLAAVKEGDLWGYIDHNGSYILAPKYLHALEFRNGKAAVKLNDGYTLIDRGGNLLFQKRFLGMAYSGTSFIAARDSANERWGFIDSKGDYVIPPTFAAPAVFQSGIGAVCEKGFCGGINLEGKEILPYHFTRLFALDKEVISATRWRDAYLYRHDGSLLYCPLNHRTLSVFALYLLPFFLPIFLAHVLARKGVKHLKNLEGEEFRLAAYGLGRKISRIRSAQILIILAMIVFGDMLLVFGSQMPEILALLFPYTLKPLGYENIAEGNSTFASLLIQVGVYLFFFVLFLLCSALTRGSWIRVEQEVFGSKMSARQFYFAHFRGFFFGVIPFGLIVAMFYYFPSLTKSDTLSIAVTFVIFFLSSSLFFGLKTKKSTKEATQFRSLVEEMREQSGVSLQNIVIFEEPTGRIANAWAAGFTPRTRQILVTQALLDRCSEDEIRAIVAHELGHMKHHDVLKRSLFALLITLMIYSGFSFFQSFTDFSVFPAGSSFFFWILIGAPAIGALVGILSRRQEFAADRYAAQLVGNPDHMIHALRKIHSAAAIPSTFGRYHRYFLGHPSLAEREKALNDLK